MSTDAEFTLVEDVEYNPVDGFYRAFLKLIGASLALSVLTATAFFLVI